MRRSARNAPPHTPERPCPASGGQAPAHGFTLIEIAVVVAIMGIILAAGIIRLSPTSVHMAQAEYTAHIIAADLRRAQSQAITDGKSHYVLFAGSLEDFTSYAIYRTESPSDVQVDETRTFPDSVTVTGSTNRVTFTPGGDALENGAYSVTASGRSFDITVTLATGAVNTQEVQL